MPDHVTNVFLHSPSEAPDLRILLQQSPALERAAERSLFLAQAGDIVCLAHPVDPPFLAFLERLEVGPRAEDILVIPGVVPGSGVSERLLRDPDALDRLTGRLASATSLRLCPFFSTAAAYDLGRLLGARLGVPVRVLGGPPRLARLLQNKRFARRLALRLGIPVAPGDTVRLSRAGDAWDTAPLREAILRNSQPTGRAIIRGAVGGAGSSTFLSSPPSMEDTLEAIARRTDNDSYLVEPLYPIVVSPNIEIDVPPNGVTAGLNATDQIMGEDLAYKGSIHPSRARRLPEMLAATERITRWMCARGFTGRAGLDFVEAGPEGGGPLWFFTEINPRVNGASYPIGLVGRLASRASQRGLPAPHAFRMLGVPTAARSFEEMMHLAGPLLYDPARGEGVVLHMNTLGGQMRAAVIALAATVERAGEVFDEVEERLAAAYSPAASRS